MFLVNKMMGQVPSLKRYLNHMWQNQELLSNHPTEDTMLCDDTMGIYILLDTMLQMHISSNCQPNPMDVEMGPRTYKYISKDRDTDTFSKYPHI